MFSMNEKLIDIFITFSSRLKRIDESLFEFFLRNELFRFAVFSLLLLLLLQRNKYFFPVVFFPSVLDTLSQRESKE